jgi:hypothetical protein
MGVQIITAPSGERLVVMPEADYRALLEAAEEAKDLEDIRAFDAALAAGEEEWVPAEFASRILDGESTIRVWREFRGLSPEQLASRAGIGMDRLIALEALPRPPEGEEVQAIAEALGLEVDDLVMSRG